jgi:hypothetical protein
MRGFRGVADKKFQRYFLRDGAGWRRKREPARMKKQNAVLHRCGKVLYVLDSWSWLAGVLRATDVPTGADSDA